MKFVKPFCVCTILHTMQPNYHALLISNVVNMPNNIGQVDCYFKKAVGFLMKYQDMTLLNNSNSDSNSNCEGTT
jgi:hypothetical protein